MRPRALAVVALAAVLAAGATGKGAARPVALAAPAEIPLSATLVSGEPAGDAFGTSVAVAGDGRTAVVGAPGARRGEGAAWIFTFRNGRWGSGTRLALGARAGKVAFGRSVAISADGKLALVGAPGKAGEVWAYRRASGGAWVGSRLPHGGALPTAFGFDVALSTDGTFALVGAPGDGRGAAWLYQRTGSTWRRLGPKLTGDHVATGALFGSSVALSGDGKIGIVGAPLDGKGSASAFALLGSTWRRQGGKLRGGNPPDMSDAVKSRFGLDVALASDGRRAVVGAPDDVGYGSTRARAGAVWLFDRSGSTWTRRGMVPGGRSQKQFGRSVALSTNARVALLGGIGVTEVWRRDSFGLWLDHRIEGANDETFGSSAEVAPDGFTAIVGAPGTTTRKGRAVLVAPVVKADKRTLPFVASLQPAFGPTVGGTRVTIHGEGFTRVRSVSFGAKAALSFDVLSPTVIGAVAPPGPVGSVDVVVRTADGTSPPVRGGWGSGFDSRFFYYDPPRVLSVTPSAGPVAGGTQVIIVGSGFEQGAVARFGGTDAASTVVESPTRIRAVSPPGQAGTVDVTVWAPSTRLTSRTSAADRFSYLSAERVITFDDLVTGGRDGFGALVRVTSQYAAQGVTFNDVSAIDYSKGPSALPGFPRSGVAIEQCVGVENCTTPIRVDFAEPQRLARVWVGFSFRLERPLEVQLAAYDAGGAVVGLTTATLLTNLDVTPIRVPLEISLATSAIRRIELSVPGGGFTGGLAVDDVTFQGS